MYQTPAILASFDAQAVLTEVVGQGSGSCSDTRTNLCI